MGKSETITGERGERYRASTTKGEEEGERRDMAFVLWVFGEGPRMQETQTKA